MITHDDPTPFIGAGGTLGTLFLADINSVLSVLVGLASLGYVVTKWVMLVRARHRDREED
jgi:hypothetical protein